MIRPEKLKLQEWQHCVCYKPPNDIIAGGNAKSGAEAGKQQRIYNYITSGNAKSGAEAGKQSLQETLPEATSRVAPSPEARIYE